MGEDSTDEISWNPNSEGHILLSGKPGTGKTVLQRTVIDHLIINPHAWEGYWVDFDNEQILPNNNAGNVSMVRDFHEFMRLLDSMIQETIYRVNLLESAEVSTYIEVEQERIPAVAIVIDEFEQILNSASDLGYQSRTQEIYEKIIKIVSVQYDIGIYFLLSSRESYLFSCNEKLMLGFSILIQMGSSPDVSFLGIIPENELIPVKGTGYMRVKGRHDRELMSVAFDALPMKKFRSYRIPKYMWEYQNKDSNIELTS